MITIQLMHSSDRAEIEALVYKYVDTDIGRIAYSLQYPENARNIENSLNGTDGGCFVAYDQEVITGYIRLLLKKSTRTNRPTVIIDDLYVQPPFRRNGIGTLLMARAFEYAHETYATYVSVEVAKKNQRAMGLYQKFGMTVRSTTTSSYLLGVSV